MCLEVDLVMPFGGEALAAREVDDRQSVACVQVIWPWPPPFPFPEKEGVCMDMTTDPSLLQKRKVVSSHYHHHRSPLSDEKRDIWP